MVMPERDPRTGRFMATKARAARLARHQARIKFFESQVLSNVQVTARARLRLAAQLLRDKVVINISRPVVKIKVAGKRRRHPTTGKFTKGTRSRTKVDPRSRSKPGEFPRADTTMLMKSIFYEMREKSAIVGTPLHYGLILETRRKRSFLVRTLNEMMPTLRLVMGQGNIGR